MLTQQQVDEYNERGYVTPDFRLPESTLERIRGLHDELVDKHPEFYNYCPTLLAYQTEYLEVARDEQIVSMVTQLIGPDVALWNSSFFAKPANGGHETPWHQDGEYWPIEPLATCTVWIAIDQATLQNGCLQVIPGSHTERRLRRHNTNPSDDVTLNLEIDSSEYDRANAAPIELEPGQISLHDVFLVHGSEANHSDHSRRGMTLRYMPTTSVFDRDKARALGEKFNMTDHSDRTLYLMAGTDASKRNDFSVYQ